MLCGTGNQSYCCAVCDIIGKLIDLFENNEDYILSFNEGNFKKLMFITSKILSNKYILSKYINNQSVNSEYSEKIKEAYHKLESKCESIKKSLAV